MNTGIDVVCGLGTFITTLGVVSNTPDGTAPWVQLVIGVVSALIFSVVSLGTKILTSYLEKKGLISHEHKKQIDETVDDLADDGKINGSNKSDIDKTEK